MTSDHRKNPKPKKRQQTSAGAERRNPRPLTGLDVFLPDKHAFRVSSYQEERRAKDPCSPFSAKESGGRSQWKPPFWLSMAATLDGGRLQQHVSAVTDCVCVSVCVRLWCSQLWRRRRRGRGCFMIFAWDNSPLYSYFSSTSFSLFIFLYLSNASTLSAGGITI